jgi:hypothetical protein
VVPPFIFLVNAIAHKEPEQGREREQGNQDKASPTNLGGVARVVSKGNQNGNIDANNEEDKHKIPPTTPNRDRHLT